MSLPRALSLWRRNRLVAPRRPLSERQGISSNGRSGKYPWWSRKYPQSESYTLVQNTHCSGDPTFLPGAPTVDKPGGLGARSRLAVASAVPSFRPSVLPSFLPSFPSFRALRPLTKPGAWGRDPVAVPSFLPSRRAAGGLGARSWLTVASAVPSFRSSVLGSCLASFRPSFPSRRPER